MESKDIYLGAIPWVFMQLILVVIVIFVPQTVTFFLTKEEKVDVDKVRIETMAVDTVGENADAQKALEDAMKDDADAASKKK